MKITLKDGSIVEVYESSQRDTVINSNDCKTEYKKIKDSRLYEIVR